VLAETYVGLRRRRVPRRVIMDHDDGRGAQLERALDDLSRLDGHMIDRASLGLLV
jgi:hypothetical protein